MSKIQIALKFLDTETHCNSELMGAVMEDIYIRYLIIIIMMI